MSRERHPATRPAATPFWPVFDAGLARTRTASLALVLTALALLVTVPVALARGVPTPESAILWRMGLVAVLAATGLAAVVAILRINAAASASLTRDLDAIRATIEALVAGDLSLPSHEPANARVAALVPGLEQLARQLLVNTATAHALAKGTARRGARSIAPSDPVGAALARLGDSMADVTRSAQRIARGDLSVTLTPASDDDALGHALAGMMHHVSATIADARENVRRLGEQAEALRADAGSLAIAADADADHLRQALDRVAYVAIQARSDADRGTTLGEEIVDSELLLDDSAAALQHAADGLRDVLGRAETVQRLARHAGLLAVYAGAEGAQAPTAIRGALPLESEAREVAHEAASVATSISRMLVDGTERVHASGVALDQVTLALRKGTTMAREMAVTVRRYANELGKADERLVQVHAAMTRNAAEARRVSSRANVLASQVRQQEAVLRRLDRGRGAPRPEPVIVAPTRPELYRTPPHAHAVLPALSMVG